MENIFKRRSVRQFKDDKIADEILKKLCYAGFAAPTARRQKSMSFVIVNDKNVLNDLANTSKNSGPLLNAQAAIAVIGNDPTQITTPHMQPQDLAAATQNILLAATALNIGSCWIGTYPLEDRMKVAKEVLKVKDEDFVFSIIALGYPLNDDAFYDAEKYDDSKIFINEVK